MDPVTFGLPHSGCCRNHSVAAHLKYTSHPGFTTDACAEGKSEVNDELSRQTRVVGPGRAALPVRQAWTAFGRLDEFVAVTGYERKYAIRLLLGPIRPPEPIRRPGAAHYGVEVQQALATPRHYDGESLAVSQDIIQNRKQRTIP